LPVSVCCCNGTGALLPAGKAPCLLPPCARRESLLAAARPQLRPHIEVGLAVEVAKELADVEIGLTQEGVAAMTLAAPAEAAPAAVAASGSSRAGAATA
jgi:hypothetical protein